MSFRVNNNLTTSVWPFSVARIKAVLLKALVKCHKSLKIFNKMKKKFRFEMLLILLKKISILLISIPSFVNNNLTISE